MESFDVVVVGARCAGSPLATMLARRGLKVCVLDRARFPSETPSTHIIQRCGVAILDELGVLDTLIGVGAAPLHHATVASDDVRIHTTVADPADHPVLCMRRLTLDVLLVEAAGAAGAEVRTGTRVTGLLRDGDHVTGVHTDKGTIHARLVVGADGRHSTVARTVGAQEYDVTPPGRMAAWGYFEGVDRTDRAWFGRMKDMGYLAGPTDGDLYMAAIAPDQSRIHEFQADRDTFFTNALRQWPELADLMADAKRVGPLRVFTKWHGYFRQSAGPGWVPVGDAGHFKDFTPGQGISDALRQAQQLAHSIEHGLAGDGLDVAMQQWWRWRDHDAYEMYWHAARMGTPGPATPWKNSLLREISINPAATQAFFQVLNHDIPPSTLHTPALALRATAHAIWDQPRHTLATVKEFISAARHSIQQTRAKQRLADPIMTMNRELAHAQR
ncbi:MAG: FAD-dependent monooxygenase [Mycobacteriaceae bacterium]|nr:FAD-dependent monooxygenase [Mycobacteriaceae bacterium]